VVAEVVQKFFPDFRRTLNELQRYAASGVIDTGILAVLNEVRLGELVSALKQKEFSTVRKWIVSNLDNDPNAILRTVYDNLYTSLVPTSIPQAVLIIAKYQYQSAFVADQEINLLAALTELMVECEFK
jgi:replication factor C small subunit